MAAKRTKNVTPSEKTKEYWEKVTEILDTSSDYVSMIKLRANLVDPVTAFKVQHVLDEYYEGKMSHLYDAIATVAEKFFAKVEKLNIYCCSEGLPIVAKPDILFNLLTNNERRKYYRDSVKKGLKTNIIIPLQVIEMNFRGRK